MSVQHRAPDRYATHQLPHSRSLLEGHLRADEAANNHYENDTELGRHRELEDPDRTMKDTPRAWKEGAELFEKVCYRVSILKLLNSAKLTESAVSQRYMP